MDELEAAVRRALVRLKDMPSVKFARVQPSCKYQVKCLVTTPDAIDLAVERGRLLTFGTGLFASPGRN